VTVRRADLAVIIVNWNTVDLLDDCLQSVLDHGPTGLSQEIVVVDNGSSDSSLEHLRTNWPSVKLITNDENVGFCRANNQAIRVTEAPYLLLINTDARLTSGCVDTMLGYLGRDPNAAVVGPRLVYGDGSFQRWTAGRSLSIGSCATYLLGLDRLAARRHARAGVYLNYDTAEPFKPGWVSSAVMLVRRDALDEIGAFDESIFVYMDDVDLCQRASDAGWNTWYAADTTAIHFMGGSSKRSGGAASPEALRAFNRWFEQRHGRRAALAVRALAAIGFGARACSCLINGLVRTDTTARNQGLDHWGRVKLCLEGSNV
jgi:N-acetylglucosaminyl-diphospho-decaprenol L-rhamnosyltransferase